MSNNQDRFEDDLVDLMRLDQGRRVFKELLNMAGLNKCSFNGQSNHTIFNEGKRSLGLIIQAELKNADPDLYNKLLTEESIYGD